MIDNTVSKDEIIKRQAKIIKALISRAERGDEIKTSHFGIFQSAIALQTEVKTKSQSLEEALRKLGSTFDELQSIQHQKETMQKSLTDALEVLEEGFALFTQKKLVLYNDHFRDLLGDIREDIKSGLKFGDYLDAVFRSSHLAFEGGEDDLLEWQNLEQKLMRQPYLSLVLPLKHERFVQVAFRQTSLGNIAILQTDITPTMRQSLEEKDLLINQHMRYLQGSFDHLPVGIASFSPDWRLQLSNKVFGDLLELPQTLTQNDTPIRKILDFLNHAVLKASSPVPTFSLPPENITSIMQSPTRLETKSNKVLTAELCEHPESGYMFSVRDITIEEEAKTAMRRINAALEKRVNIRTKELNAANQELRSAKEFAERANISKTRFLAAASHDLLQPVNAAKLYISMLQDRHLKGLDANYVNRLHQAFQNMENLLHDLLDISHLESNTTKFNRTSIRLGDFLDNIRDYLHQLANSKNIELRVHCADLYIKSDPHYLARILQNLIVNAIQYTPENGKVLIAARKREDHVDLEIWDTGIGIDDADLERIFQEFTRIERNKAPSAGMGLGLSIVDQACRQLDHKLTVQSQKGKGSLFRIHVPFAPKIPPPRPETKPKTDDTAFDCLILLVENDPEVLFATASLLESWGAHVLAVPSVEQALIQYRELGEAPHLIISDYKLDDDETGLDAIHLIRQETGRDLPAIIITAHHSEALERSATLNDFSVLKKPIHLASLRKLIATKANKLIPKKEYAKTSNYSRG